MTKFSDVTPSLDREPTLQEIEAFGRAVAAGMRAEGREAHAQNVDKVIAWAATLKDLPSVSAVGACFRVLAAEWNAVQKGKANGTGSYNLQYK